MPSTPRHNTDPTGLPATKACKRCEELLPLSHYHKHTIAKDGLQVNCKACSRQISIEWKANNEFRNAINTSRSSAKAKGIAFNLTEDYIKSIDRDDCPYLEIPIKFYPGGRGQNNRPMNLKSLDRIDSRRGYVQGNVTFCSWGANCLLSNHGAEQLLAIPLLHRVGINFMRLLNSTQPTK